MITVNEALETLGDEGFDIVVLPSPAQNVPSRYRIARSNDLVVFFWNDQQLIAFVEGYRLGFANGYWDGQGDMLDAEADNPVAPERTIE